MKQGPGDAARASRGQTHRYMTAEFEVLYEGGMQGGQVEPVRQDGLYLFYLFIFLTFFL